VRALKAVILRIYCLVGSFPRDSPVFSVTVGRVRSYINHIRELRVISWSVGRQQVEPPARSKVLLLTSMASRSQDHRVQWRRRRNKVQENRWRSGLGGGARQSVRRAWARSGRAGSETDVLRRGMGKFQEFMTSSDVRGRHVAGNGGQHDTSGSDRQEWGGCGANHAGVLQTRLAHTGW